jgi:hypothetical protein
MWSCVETLGFCPYEAAVKVANEGRVSLRDYQAP